MTLYSTCRNYWDRSKGRTALSFVINVLKKSIGIHTINLFNMDTQVKITSVVYSLFEIRVCGQQKIMNK